MIFIFYLIIYKKFYNFYKFIKILNVNLIIIDELRNKKEKTTSKNEEQKNEKYF